MTTAQMNGLEYLTAIKNGELPGSAMGQLIPMKLSVVRENYVEYEVYPDERHFNLQGGIHGGFCATVLDSVTGAAVHTTVDAGVSFSTIDLNVKMLKAMKNSETYTAIGEVIRIGRNVLTSEGRIVDKDGKLYAFGSATLLVTGRK
ncbi:MULTISPECIES: PaaI family thioesterase [Acinetobacter]|mgnify:FL=1|uniref:PaaI family thioesterase n=1 Tax=Acinetobacter variabilis TaxID=70346 RepID=A0A7T8ANE6_9GAMM|nr:MULTISPECIES: PaaI family thioesterase [Acinetobacter]QQN86801.1 PaaI family thioesterase [Acinetobacter variabilis]